MGYSDIYDIRYKDFPCAQTLESRAEAFPYKSVTFFK